MDCARYLAAITRPVTVFDVLLVATTILFLIIVGFRCLFAADKIRNKALRNYEKRKPEIRKWISLPPEVMRSDWFVWNIRFCGIAAIAGGLAVLILIVIASWQR
jgi:hypothetical protein